jgi:xylan 1,4-beta-xylosidase
MPEEVDALATFNGRDRVAVLLWRHADDQYLIDSGETEVTLRIERLPFGAHPVHIRHWRIDARHSNSYTAWQEIGAPQDPSLGELRGIKDRQRLELLEPDRTETVNDSCLVLRIRLPLPSVSLIEISVPGRSL